MDQNQRPHSRKKNVGTGSVGVNLGHKVEGASPVGSGGRREDRPSGRESSGAQTYRAGKKLSLKSILIIAVLVIGAYFIMSKLKFNYTISECYYFND